MPKSMLLCLCLCLPLTPACIITLEEGDDDWDWSEMRVSDDSAPNSPAQVASLNRAGLERLEPGMSVAEMQEIMRRHVYRAGSSGEIANPHRRESYPLPDGSRTEVFFYYTDPQRSDGMITEDELTPIWFVSGSLAGWGRMARRAGLEPRARVE